MYELHHGCNNKISTFPVGISLIRELKNDDGDGNKNGKKAMGLD